MLTAVRGEAVYLKPMQSIVQASYFAFLTFIAPIPSPNSESSRIDNEPSIPDEDAKSKNLLILLELLGSAPRTYHRKDHIHLLQQVWSAKDPDYVNIFHYNAYLKVSSGGMFCIIYDQDEAVNNRFRAAVESLPER